MSEKYAKQIIILRKDLKMPKGKLVAQSAHASMAAVFDHFGKPLPIRLFHFAWKLFTHSALRQWMKGAFTKIAVTVNSEEELDAIYQQAKDAGFMCSYIVDNGRTVFNGVPTKTAVAVGPAYDDELEPLTGKLPLLN